MKARAVNPRKPHEMTKAEIAWSKHDWFVNTFGLRRYEAVTLRFGDVRYTPDWSGIDMGTYQLCFFEIKARDHPAVFTPVAKLRLKTFATEFSEYRFFVCWPIKPKGSWHIGEISNRSCRDIGCDSADVLPGQTDFLRDTP